MSATVLSDAELQAIADVLDKAEAQPRLDGEWDAALAVVTRAEEVLRLIELAEPSVTAARACCRAAVRVGGEAPAHVRWLLAGAFSLQGLDDVAHALEPEQQATGFVKRVYAERPPHAG